MSLETLAWLNSHIQSLFVFIIGTSLVIGIAHIAISNRSRSSEQHTQHPQQRNWFAAIVFIGIAAYAYYIALSTLILSFSPLPSTRPSTIKTLQEILWIRSGVFALIGTAVLLRFLRRLRKDQARYARS